MVWGCLRFRAVSGYWSFSKKGFKVLGAGQVEVCHSAASQDRSPRK